MVISYFGAAFFRVSFGDTTLAFNPVSKQSKLKQSRYGADIALLSLDHPDGNGVENVTHGERTPFVIDGPGEYEVKSVTVRGYETGTAYTKKRSINTVYLVTLEGLRLCFLGFLNSRKLPPEILEALDNIDILFLPVGGEGVLGAEDAHKLSVELEPKIVIPMLYDNATLKKFLKEESIDKRKPVDKFTLKKKDLEGKEGEVVVFSSP